MSPSIPVSSKAQGKQPERPIPARDDDRTPRPFDGRRGRTPYPRLKTSDDAYIAAMFQSQAKQFLTEGDNRVHVDRFPSPFRRAMLPSPAGQARVGVAYFDAEMGDSEAGPAAVPAVGIMRRLADLVMRAWHSLRGTASEGYEALLGSASPALSDSDRGSF